jgi:hypothetical protein
MKGSIIPRALVDPQAQDLDLLRGEGFCPQVRHAQGRIRTSFHQHVEDACPAVAGYDHRSVECALHQTLVGFHAEMCFQVPLAVGRPVAFKTVGFQDRVNILMITDRLPGEAAGQQGDNYAASECATVIHTQQPPPGWSQFPAHPVSRVLYPAPVGWLWAEGSSPASIAA